jgi:GxxExxY protein
MPEVHGGFMIEEELTKQVINCAFKVHTALGHGLLESAYKACLHYELNKANLNALIEVPMPLIYDDIRMECGYRADIMVDNKVIIEVKAIEALNNVHVAQVLTYLRLSNCRIGLLMNFHVEHLRSGIKRLML